MSLETFVPEPVSPVVEIAGETLAIAPLKVGELPTFIRAIRPFAQHLTPDVIDWLACCSASAARSGLGAGGGYPQAARVGGGAGTGRGHSIERGGVRSERRFFYPAPGPGARAGGETGGDDWGALLQRLVGHGHRYPDVLNYTVAQVRAFSEAIERSERLELAASSRCW
jgi:hypothetical protein